MNEHSFELLEPDNLNQQECIANWYLQEWNIPTEKTILKLNTLAGQDNQFQVLMLQNNLPVATGGVYNHVGLLDLEPRFGIYKHWLALVYTQPQHRNQGLGALICENIQQQAKNRGLKHLHLFTHTAESLYSRLGWTVQERLELGGKQVVVMKKEL